MRILCLFTAVLLSAISPLFALAADDFTEGELLKASRQFVVAESTLDTPLVYQFVISVIDSETNATRALNETLERQQISDESFTVISYNVVSGPVLYDESTWFVVRGLSEGVELQFSSVIFRIGSIVELWLVVSAVGFSMATLENLTQSFEVDVPASISQENILSMLPGMTDIPAGYYLNEETVEPGDEAKAHLRRT